ncbi:MAG TPA: hypothetical protein VD886_01570, partial [Herpetosiphonaceae bacterium]|nr:hypothetical protein [Herpetosiphonaceae bacterium]
ASPYLVWVPVWQQIFRVDPAAALADNLVQVQATVARLAPDRLDQLPLLGTVLALPIPENELTRALDPHLRKAWLETLLIQMLRASLADQTARGQRLLLVLEDLHWLDQLSVDLLGQVVAALETLPLTLLLTARELTPIPAVATTIPLGDLDAAAIDQLLTARLALRGQTLSPDGMARLSTQIAHQAAGNPFYVEEVLTYLAGAGLTLDDRRGWEQLDLPVGLHRLVLSRIDRLDAHAQRVLKIASILGVSFPRAWLWSFYPTLGGEAVVAAALTTLEGAELLAASADPAVARFKHAITREVTYESLAQASRGILHEQCAAHLEQAAGDDSLAMVAYHYDRSPNDAKAITFLARSAAHAASLFANAAAVHQYQAALARAAQPGVASPLPLGNLASGLGDVYAQMAEFDAALDQYDQARADLTDTDLAQAELDLRRADVLVRATRLDEAMTVIAQTEAHLAPEAERTQARVIRAGLANLRSIKAMRHGDHRQALHWAEQGIALLASLPNEDQDVATTRIRLAQSLISAAGTSGDLKRAHQTFTSAVRLLRRYPNPMVEGELQLRRALLAMVKEKVTVATRLFHKALPLIEATGTRDRLAYLLLPGGQTLVTRGKYQEGQAWLERGTRLGEETGSTFLISAGLFLLGWLHVALGQWDSALGYLRRGNHLATQHELRERLVGLMLFEGQVYMHRGDYRKSEAVFVQTIDLATRYGLDRWIVQCQHNLAYNALNQGDVAQAMQYREGRTITCGPITSGDQALDVLSSAEWWAHLSASGGAKLKAAGNEQMLSAMQQSVTFLRANGHTHFLPFAYRVNAMVAYESGTMDNAHTWAGLGVRLGTRIGHKAETARCFLWRGKTTLLRMKDRRLAQRDIQQALHIFEHLGAWPEVEQARRLLTGSLHGNVDDNP